MNALVNVLFILTPFLLPVLVYFEYQASLVIMNKDPILERKPYTLLQLHSDIITLFIHVLILASGAFPGVIKDGWSCFPLIIIMIIVLTFISHDRAKIKDIMSLNIFNLSLNFIAGGVCGIVIGVVSNVENNHLRLTMIIITVSFILFSVYVSRYHAKLENGTLRNMVAGLAMVTLYTSSRGLATFFILAIMNYFFGLELYAFNI